MTRPLSLFALIALVLPLAGGCNLTPAQKLYLARQGYIGTEQAVTKLIRAGVIPAGPKLDATVAVRDEARAALAAADAAIGTFGFDFVMGRAESALGRFAQVYLDNRPAPDGLAEPGATPWTPPRSRPPSPASRRSSASPAAPRKPSASSRAVRTSPLRNRTPYAPRSA